MQIDVISTFLGLSILRPYGSGCRRRERQRERQSQTHKAIERYRKTEKIEIAKQFTVAAACCQFIMLVIPLHLLFMTKK